ncbi:MAG: lipocalin family protein [Bacteroidales bacterium]|nr:lipocalin family protein [Bacteroidales bacterium]
MKTTVSILLFILSITAAKAQVNELIGTWSVFEMTQLMNQDSYKMTEDSLKAHSLFQDYFFMEDSRFRQTGNLSGQGSVTTQEGTWKITDNVIIMTLQMGEREIDVDYTLELKNNILFLTRSNPAGTMKITMALRKK